MTSRRFTGLLPGPSFRGQYSRSQGGRAAHYGAALGPSRLFGKAAQCLLSPRADATAHPSVSFTRTRPSRAPVLGACGSSLVNALHLLRLSDLELTMICVN